MCAIPPPRVLWFIIDAADINVPVPPSLPQMQIRIRSRHVKMMKHEMTLVRGLHRPPCALYGQLREMMCIERGG